MNYEEELLGNFEQMQTLTYALKDLSAEWITLRADWKQENHSDAQPT